MAKMFRWIKRLNNEKKQYKVYVSRKKELPSEYQIVIKEVEKYLWNYANNSKMLDALYNFLEMFETGARENRDVLTITGEDVGAFCDSLLSQLEEDTWTGIRKNKLNSDINERLQKERKKNQ